MTTTSMSMIDLIRKSQSDGADIDFLGSSPLGWGQAAVAYGPLSREVIGRLGRWQAWRMIRVR